MSKADLVLHPDHYFSFNKKKKQPYNTWLKSSEHDIVDIENFMFGLAVYGSWGGMATKMPTIFLPIKNTKINEI